MTKKLTPKEYLGYARELKIPPEQEQKTPVNNIIGRLKQTFMNRGVIKE